MSKVALRFGRILLLALAVAGPIPCAETARAVELEGIQFAERLQLGDRGLEVNCLGLLRYKRIFRAYVAALYLGTGVSPRDALSDVPKRLELSYFWSIRGADFGSAGDEILTRNVDAETLAHLRPRLDRINALYEDVRSGDRYSLTYIPGTGTELALNDQRKGTIEGADFAAAYFRIWLGDQPIDTTLRNQLLDCPQARARGNPSESESGGGATKSDVSR